jgi:hypothetical protein
MIRYGKKLCFSCIRPGPLSRLLCTLLLIAIQSNLVLCIQSNLMVLPSASRGNPRFPVFGLLCSASNPVSARISVHEVPSALELPLCLLPSRMFVELPLCLQPYAPARFICSMPIAHIFALLQTRRLSRAGACANLLDFHAAVWRAFASKQADSGCLRLGVCLMALTVSGCRVSVVVKAIDCGPAYATGRPARARCRRTQHASKTRAWNNTSKVSSLSRASTCSQYIVDVVAISPSPLIMLDLYS